MTLKHFWSTCRYCTLRIKEKDVSATQTKIAIIGGGIAGSTTALLLAQSGIQVTLFETKPSLVSGPPFCHLHAGGNLYPDISDEQCLRLLEQSIDFARLYPNGVDHRPTIIALPQECSKNTQHLLPRLEKLRSRYAQLIEKESKNRVLGDPETYFRLYDKETIEHIAKHPFEAKPHTPEAWLVPFAKEVDLNTIQFPVIMVQEYGLNLFRIGARLMLSLQQHPNVSLRLSTAVKCVLRQGGMWQINTDTQTPKTETFDYLINAAGYQTGKIDDMIGLSCERMVEFKAAYVTQWKQESRHLWPEIIFHGERGTPRGMGQFTPYPGGHFQLHGMTKEITLYEEGLVANTPQSCQPQLPKTLLEKIEHDWQWRETVERTQNAITHLARFIPSFASASVASKPLFGAQQIPGNDPTLRVAEVAFPTPRYARCEIVKVSSVIDMAEAILNDLAKEGLTASTPSMPHLLEQIPPVDEASITHQAEALCKERGYPTDLAHLCVQNIAD